MAKSKTAKAKAKAAVQRRVPAPRMVRTVRSSLDAQAQAWAQLLNDPCGGPIVHPCYPGSDGGILMRFENSYDIGVGATETAGVFVFTPGAIGTNGVLSTGILAGSAANSSTNLTLAGPSNVVQPGYSFLASNSSNVRPVAACIQMTFLGAESARSGVISYGNINGGTFLASDTPNALNASNVFEHFCRTPVDTLEIKWRPSSYDPTFRDVSTNIGANELGKLGAVGFSYNGLQTAAGMRVRMVVVYEYTPGNQVGIVNVARSRSTSNNSLDHVINYLDSTGDWMVRLGSGLGRAYRGAQSVAPYVRAVTYGGTRIAGMLM